MKRPTINDVALHAGVSRATVSLVVRDADRIPQATKERVRASMEALGYVYNRRAAEMRSRSSQTIGLVVANVRNPYFAELTMAVEEAAGEAGYTVLLGCSSDDPKRQAQILRAMTEQGVDGLILLPASHTDPAEMRSLVANPRLPHVLVTRAIPGFSSDYVGADNDAAGEQVGRHLRSIGARSVAYLGGVDHSIPREERRRGLLTGLGIGQQDLAADAPSSYDSAVDPAPLLDEALSAGIPDAIVTYNDMYAFAVMGVLRARGLEPGRDIAVVSFDDVPEAVRSYPALSSAAGFPDRVGTLATRLVLGSITDPSPESKHILVQPALQVRQSTSAWAGTRARTGPRRKGSVDGPLL